VVATTMSITNLTHESFLRLLVEKYENKRFNLLVKTRKLDGDEKVLKFCNRMISKTIIPKPFQVSIKLSPGGCIAWDLKTEQVSTTFEGDDVIICRFFDNRQYCKVLIITSDPI